MNLLLSTTQPVIRRIISLLSEHPILALPVIAADLLSFLALHVQHALQQPLFALAFGNTGSVLATKSSAFVLTAENASKAALLAVPLLWGCYFLSVCFYSTALLTTFSLYQHTREDRKPNLRSAFAHALANLPSVFAFSMRIFAGIVLSVVAFGLLISAGTKAPWSALHMGRDAAYLIVFCIETAFIYFFVPRALKLLLTGPAHYSAARQMAIMLGIIALVTQYVFLLLLEHVAPSFIFEQKTILGALVRAKTESVIGALPYVLFFVGLSVLAAGTEQSALEENP